MAIPAHVRQFMSVENRRFAKVNGVDFDKKSHFIHVRPADQIDVVVLGIHGNNNDKDVCDTAFFVALTPRSAVQLATMIEDVLVNDFNFNFDRVRRETLNRLNKKEAESEREAPAASAG